MSNKPFFILLLTIAFCQSCLVTHAQQGARFGVEILPGAAFGSLSVRRDPLALDYGLTHRIDPRFGCAIRLTAEWARSRRITVFAGFHAGYQRLHYVIQHRQRGLIIAAQDGTWYPNYQGWPYLNVGSRLTYFDFGAPAGIRYTLSRRWRVDAAALISYVHMGKASAQFEEKPLRPNQPDFGPGIQREHSPVAFNIAPELALCYLIPLPGGQALSAGIGYSVRVFNDELAPYYTLFRRQTAFAKVGYVLR